jgi:hypothetical protein
MQNEARLCECDLAIPAFQRPSLPGLYIREADWVLSPVRNLMMETESDLRNVYLNHLTWLSAKQDCVQ